MSRIISAAIWGTVLTVALCLLGIALFELYTQAGGDVLLLALALVAIGGGACGAILARRC